jgi:hypothetical protein
MLLQPIWDWLEADVLSLPVESGGPRPLFNPYREIDPAVDRPRADHIRRRTCAATWKLHPLARCAGDREAPGWRGCRFSGVPFTSEAQLSGGPPFCGSPLQPGRPAPCRGDGDGFLAGHAGILPSLSGVEQPAFSPPSTRTAALQPDPHSGGNPGWRRDAEAAGAEAQAGDRDRGERPNCTAVWGLRQSHPPPRPGRQNLEADAGDLARA